MNILSKLIRYPFRLFIKSKFINKKKLKDRFLIIYKNNYWDNSETVSGPGSTLKTTVNLRKKLKKVIKKYNIKSIFDAPCGDCNWIEKIIKNSRIRYIGADIVNDIIVKNKKKFNDNKIAFKKMDITKEKIPKTDLFICRDFLFHLSYEDIYIFLKNLKKSNSKYLLISSHYKNEKIKNINKNIHSGDFRKIDIFQPPFNFNKNYVTVIDDYCDNTKKYLYLFKRKDFVKFFDLMSG
tara:strand:+ start:62 stop:772 length:711 start_codon:yes stop_codon:yes gene_type:complete